MLCGAKEASHVTVPCVLALVGYKERRSLLTAPGRGPDFRASRLESVGSPLDRTCSLHFCLLLEVFRPVVGHLPPLTPPSGEPSGLTSGHSHLEWWLHPPSLTVFPTLLPLILSGGRKRQSELGGQSAVSEDRHRGEQTPAAPPEGGVEELPGGAGWQDRRPP